MPLTRTVPCRAVLTAFGLFALTSPTWAALPNATDIQNQLQAEWSDFTSRIGTDDTKDSKITVTQQGNGYKAVLPPLAIKMQDKNLVKLSAINVIATPSAAGNVNLNIILPNRIPQFYGNIETGALTIAKQNLNVAVKPAGDTWQVQSVDGQMSNLSWKQSADITTNPKAPMEASVNQLALTGKPSQLQLKASNINARNIEGDKQSISDLVITQQPSTPQSLRLSDILVLLTDTLPQLDSGKGGMAAWLEGAASMTADIHGIRNVDSTGKTTLSIDKVNLKNSLASIVDNKMTLRTTGTVTGIEMKTPPAFAQTSPKTLNFTSTVRNLPVQYFSMPFNTPEAQQLARTALANAKTQLQIDSLNVDTVGGLKATGTGLLTATTVAPTYATGNVNLNLTNLQDTLQKIQQQRAPNQSQLMMVLMVLQGMGQKAPNSNQTTYNVNLTPTGGVMVNNQDFSSIMTLAGVAGAPAAKPANTGRAIPVAPVETGPISTPWKQ